MQKVMISIHYMTPSSPVRPSEVGEAQGSNAFISGHDKKSAAKEGIGSQPMSLIK